MPYPLQVRLLRVLQERLVNPLGSAKSIPVDVAIICATHRDLREMIAENRFREDLYYRLNGLVVKLPPLRERSDLRTVVQRMLQQEASSAVPLSIAPDVMQLFEQCRWPGNFRQLGNLLRTAAAMVDDDGEIRIEHLPDDFFDDIERGATPAAGAAPAAGADLHTFTASAITAALARHNGNVSAAARSLGISRNTIYRRVAVGARTDDA
jgi:transcriptional regulator of acetoin/glycerol metabolism